MAQFPDVLLCGEDDPAPALAVPGLIHDEPPRGMRRQRRVRLPQRQPPSVEGGAIPGRIVDEVVQPLPLRARDERC
jgi:hypothetical protein